MYYSFSTLMADIWFPTGDISNSFRSNIIDCLFFFAPGFPGRSDVIKNLFFLCYLDVMLLLANLYQSSPRWLIYVWHVYTDWWLHIYSLPWLAHLCMTCLRWLVVTYLFSAVIGSFMYYIFTLIGGYIFILCSDWPIMCSNNLFLLQAKSRPNRQVRGWSH